METLDFWNDYLRTYDALNMHRAYREYLEAIARRVCQVPRCDVLDAGSGTGNLSVVMKRMGARVLSLDFSPVALAIHRDKDLDAQQVLASLEEVLPLPDAKFDTVVCASVLFTLTPPGVKNALREFRRVLKPGGRLIVTVMKESQTRFQFAWEHICEQFSQPIVYALLGTARSLVPLCKMLYYNLTMRRLQAKNNYRRYSKEALLGEVRDAGFHVVHYELAFAERFHLVEAKSPIGISSSCGKPTAQMHAVAIQHRPGVV